MIVRVLAQSCVVITDDDRSIRMDDDRLFWSANELERCMRYET